MRKDPVMMVELKAFVYVNKDTGEHFILSLFVNDVPVLTLEDKPADMGIETARRILVQLFPARPDIAETFSGLFAEDILARWKFRTGRMVLKIDFAQWLLHIMRKKQQEHAAHG